MDSEDEDLSFDARAAYRAAKTARRDSPRRSRSKLGGANKVGGGWQVLDGVNRRTGERNRSYSCGIEYHLAPKCPRQRRWEPDNVPRPPPANEAPRSSSPPISIDNFASVRTEGTKNA